MPEIIGIDRVDIAVTLLAISSIIGVINGIHL
jgi:hypothetical protein